MALVVNTNVPSIASQRYLMESRNEMETAMERLSSGKRINSSADDAAGLSIATRMDTQTRGLNMAIRNANDGISIVQSAEGAMQEVTEMLQRMRELAVQASSGANSAVDRAALDAEVQALKDEINRVSETTLFNNVNLLDGTYAASMQIGSNAGDVMNISIGSISTSALGMGNGSSSSGGANVLVSGRVALDTSTAIHAGDIEVNGVALGGYNGASTDLDSIGTTNNNIADFVDLINDADAGVVASAFNTVVASTVGTGIVAADELSIQVGAVGNNPVVEQVIGASTNMDELVANINLAMGGAVAASTDSAGRLVLSNTTGASISVTELSGTSGATDTGSGFQDEGGTISVYTGSATNTFNGFLKLESANGEDITIMRGNAGLAAPGSLTDLSAVGFREVSESPEGQPYSVTGIALTSSGVAAAIGNNELTINGVEIYEESLSNASTSFQGKLDLINAFTTETAVIASAYFEKSFDFIVCNGVLHHTGNTFRAFDNIIKYLNKNGTILLGLYNKYGRVRTNVRRMLFSLFGKNIIYFLDPVIRNLKSNISDNIEKINAWIQDQYIHPIEHQHTVDEVLKCFKKNEIEFISSQPPMNFSIFERNILFEKQILSNYFHRILRQVLMIFQNYF